MFKVQPVMRKPMKVNNFRAFLLKKALQTIRNTNASNKRTLEVVPLKFRKKYMRPGSRATAKHKWYILFFDQNTKSLSDFLEEVNEYAERALGGNAQQMLDSLLHTKFPQHLITSINLAYLDNGAYDQLVALITHGNRRMSEKKAAQKDWRVNLVVVVS